MLFFKRSNFGTSVKIPPTVVCFWSPYGRDTAVLSLNTAKELARYTNILLTELPCLGIPRLGLLMHKMDRDKNTNALILEYEKNKAISLNNLHKESDALNILTADVLAIPDHPVCSRVELETLIEFPGILINTARQNGINTIVFDLQGQLATPMTFFALKKADKILIPVDTPEEAAFALINIKRMLEVFYHKSEKFLILTKGETEVVEAAMRIKGKEGLFNLDVAETDPISICRYLARGQFLLEHPLDFTDIFTFFKRTKIKGKSCKENTKNNQDEAVRPELRIHL